MQSNHSKKRLTCFCRMVKARSFSLLFNPPSKIAQFHQANLDRPMLNFSLIDGMADRLSC